MSPSRLLTTGCALLLLGTTGCGLFGGSRVKQILDERHAKEELLDLELRMFEAIRDRDREKLAGLLAPEFELRTPGQLVMKRAKFIEQVTSLPGKILAVQSDDIDVKVYGDVGVLTGTQRSAVRLDDGATVTDIRSFTDVAVRRGGVWKLVLAHSTVIGG